MSRHDKVHASRAAHAVGGRPEESVCACTVHAEVYKCNLGMAIVRDYSGCVSTSQMTSTLDVSN